MRGGAAAGGGVIGTCGEVGRRGGAGSGAIGVTMRGGPEFQVGGSLLTSAGGV